jgi:molybdopterin synthase catalytic subunit
MTALATAPPTVGLTHAAIVERALGVSELVQMVANPGAGATSVFLGTVRNSDSGRAVVGIDYQAYAAMAARELRAIVTEAAHQFGTRAIAVEHRSGFLAVGEISVVIVASHERRGPAFDATRYVIEHIKRRVPIWKREHYADGTRDWVDPTRGPHGSSADGMAEGHA